MKINDNAHSKGGPRIPPLSGDKIDDETAELLSRVGPFADRNIFTTMVRHPRLYKRWVPYGTAMLYSKLPARDRELLILRTAHRCACVYEWTEHVRAAADVEITGPEIERIQSDSETPGWSEADRSLIRAVDEFIDQRRISDSTWSALSHRYSQSLMIEVLLVIGHYLGLGMTLNSLGVPTEQEGPK